MDNTQMEEGMEANKHKEEEEESVEEDSETEESTEGESSSDTEEDGSGDEIEDGSEEEWETDSEDSSEEEQEVGEAGPSGMQNIDYSSDSSNPDAECCPICLCRIRDQDVGTPESCDHTFCLECIQEWSKNVNTCPVDRQVYRLILAKHSPDGVIFKRIPVENRNLQLEEEAAGEDQTFCEVCGRSDHEDRLLLCDSCDLGYHCECLTPPLDSVPVGEWFCPTCMQAQHRVDEERGVAGRRRIARTLVSERVRAVIAEARSRGGRRIIVSDSESENEDVPESVMDVVDAVHASHLDGSAALAQAMARKNTAKRKTKKRRKTCKRRKTTKKARAMTKTKSTSSTTGLKKRRKVRRRRRKGKKRKGKRMVRTKSSTPSTVKLRLAGRLGLSKPPTGRTIPMLKEPVERPMDQVRSDMGVSSLSILGGWDELEPLDLFSDDEMVGGEDGLAMVRARDRTRIMSHKALRSCCSIPFSRPRPVISSRPKLPSPKGADEATRAGFDLLGSIMMETSKMFTKTEHVTIHKDGSLEHKATTSSKTLLDLKNCKSPRVCGEQEPEHTSQPRDNDGGSQPGTSPESPSSSASDHQGEEQEQHQSGDAVYDPSEPTGSGDGEMGSGESQSGHDDNHNVTGDSTARDEDNQDTGSSQDGNEVEAEKPSTREDDDVKEEGTGDLEVQQESDLEVHSDNMETESQDGNEAQDNRTELVAEGTLKEEDSNRRDKYDPLEPTGDGSGSEDQDAGVHHVTQMVKEDVESLGDQRDEVGEGNREELEGDGSEADLIEEDEEDTKVPISELPRIPKLRRKDGADDEDSSSSHRGSVLDRLGKTVDRQESYPKWEKRDKHRGGETEDYTYSDETERHRHSRHKHRDKDRSRRSRDRGGGTEEPDKRRKHHRSRSKERRRDRSHSRSGRHSRDRSRDKKRGRGGSSDHKHRRRSRSRTPRHHRHGDRRGEERSERRGDRDDYKASVKLFSQSLKEASEGDGSSGRRFKLKRNFYQGQTEQQPPPPQEPTKKTKFEDMFRPDTPPEVRKVESRVERVEGRGERVEGRGERADRGEARGERVDGREDHKDDILRKLESKRDEIQKKLNRQFVNKTRPSKVALYVDENSMSPDMTEPAEVLQFSPKPSVVNETKEPCSPVHRTPPRRTPPRTSPPLKKESKRESPYRKKESTRNREASVKKEAASKKEATSKKEVVSQDESYDPSEPTEDLTPEHSPRPSPPRLQTTSNQQQQPPSQPPVSAPLPPISREELLKLTSHLVKPNEMVPSGPRAVPPGNMMMHPMRIGMIQHGMPPTQQPLILNHHMLVNAPPPPPFGRIPRFGPARLGWPPNVLVHNRMPGSQNGVPHRPGERILMERHNPPLPPMRPGMQPPGPPMSERVQFTTPPPPLPAKALQEMEQISQLLNAQAKLAQMIPGTRAQKPPDVFKVPTSTHAGGETTEVVDMDVASPLSDDDLVMSFSPPPEKPEEKKKGESSKSSVLGELNKEEDVPTSAVELDKHQKVTKYIKKLNRQERVVEEVKLAIKPHYSKGKIDKEEYKEIMRKAVPKICNSKSGDINPVKIRSLVEAYVEKIRKLRKYLAKKDSQANGVQKPKQ